MGSRAGLPRKEQILVTHLNAGAVCLLNLSEDAQFLSVSHVIFGNAIEHLIDRLHFTVDIIIVTDRTSMHMDSGEVKVIQVEKNDMKKSFGYLLNDNVKSRFGLWNRSECLLLCSHHPLCKITVLDHATSLYFAQEGKAGQNDRLEQKARLYYPVRLAAKGHPLYVAEHPVESQGAIRMACSLEGFT